MRQLQVSRSTQAFLARGHPWVRRDRHTRGLDQCTSGEAVTLVGEGGRGLASALVDRAHPAICARVYHHQPDRPFDPVTALQRAWQRRGFLHQDPTTDAYRIVHGEADFLPGLRIERYGPVSVILAQAACMQAHLPLLGEALQALDRSAVIVLREQFHDLRQAPIRSHRRDGRPCDPDERVACRELSVRWEATPFADLATGIYVDQRATRAWLRGHCAGRRVLNLFAYTGLFSVSLLQAGAATAMDVDLSGPALASASHLAACNGVGERHHTRKADCTRFLRQESGDFDLIICDPPTAAQGGQGWVARRDYPSLLVAALQRLAPGGLLWAASNTLGKPYDLARALEAAVHSTGLRGQIRRGPDPGPDVPLRKGFGEGRPFRSAVFQHAAS